MQEREQGSDGEHGFRDDPVAEEFFSTPPPVVTETGEPAHAAAPMGARDHKLMVASLSMMATAAVVMVAYGVLYEQVFAPGGGSGAAAAVTEPATVAESGSEAESDSVTEAEPETEPGSEAGSDSVTESDSVAESETEPATEAEPGSEAESDSVTESDPDSVSATDSVTEADSESDSVFATDAEPDPVTESEPGSVSRRVARSPSAVERLTKRAFAALRAGDPGRAVALSEAAIAADPSRSGAYVALAGAHDALGDSEASRRAFRRCVAQATDPMASTCRSLAR
jgi:hypothetical protein